MYFSVLIAFICSLINEANLAPDGLNGVHDGGEIIKDAAYPVIRIGVVNEQPQATTCTGPGILDHLHVGIGIARGQDRTHTNVFIDTHRLAPTAGAALAAPTVLS